MSHRQGHVTCQSQQPSALATTLNYITVLITVQCILNNVMQVIVLYH